MAFKTLSDFATDEMLTHLLIKERAKFRRRNRSDKRHKLNKECDLFELCPRKMLSRMMPPRDTWVRPSRRKRLDNNAVDTSKNAEKALLLTIQRDRKLKKEGNNFDYLKELDGFIEKIKKRLSSENIQLEHPQLKPILKKKEILADGTIEVTCRPLSVYSKLEDKIILSLTSRYLTCYFDKFLHSNILSYRPARLFLGQQHHVTDFNDGIKLIQEFRKAHEEETIYVTDCDIKKFYDIIPHGVVRDCFHRLLDKTNLGEDGKAQVMKVLNAYLESYNFFTHVHQEALQNDEIFYKIRRRLHDRDNKNLYRIKWVKELEQLSEDEKTQLGVPQGGSLSLLIANIVLNDVDKVFTNHHDDNMLFVRYCDDMILLHTDEKACHRLMEQYAESLCQHGLYYHDLKNVSDGNRQDFWEVKSHLPFLWGDGKGNCNRYIGFLGYEIRRDGRMRLRKSNIERFEDKVNRLKYALRRYREEHTEEEFQEHLNNVLTTKLKGVDFYESLDMERFKKGSQYKYLKKLCDRVSKKFSS